MQPVLYIILYNKRVEAVRPSDMRQEEFEGGVCIGKHPLQ